MVIRKATHDDVDAILEIYDWARDFMRRTGNSGQWSDDYPREEHIAADIAAGACYVCVVNEKIAGVFYFNVEEEPTYGEIEGAWLDDGPYGVVHRIARGPGHKGIGAFCLDWCFASHPNIRIDTHRDNAPMRALLENLGYTYCGVIYLQNGAPRLAFQKSREINFH